MILHSILSGFFCLFLTKYLIWNLNEENKVDHLFLIEKCDERHRASFIFIWKLNVLNECKL